MDFILCEDRGEYQSLHSKNNFHFLQSWDWGEIKKPIWKPVRFKVLSENNKSHTVTVWLRKYPVFPYYFAYVPRLRLIGESPFNIQILKNLTKVLRKFNISHILLDPDTELTDWEKYNDKMAACLLQSGFKPIGPSIQPGCTRILDIQHPDEVLLKSFKKEVRKDIRRAEKKNIFVKIIADKGLDDFFQVLATIENMSRIKFHNHDYFYNILEKYGEENVLFIGEYIKENHNLRVIGAYLIVINGSLAHSLYGGCNKMGKNLRAMPYLTWKTIQILKEKKIAVFDQWGVAPLNASPDHYLYGIGKHKAGFNGRYVEYPLQYAYVFNPLFYFLYKFIRKLKSLN